MNYIICKYCDHFIEENIDYTPESGFCQYIHLDDGDIEYNHNATPDETLPSGDWGILRPDLFTLNIDNRVGPNSYHHRRPPRVCPFCSSREHVIQMGDWKANSLELQDLANAATIIEYQCTMCCCSFWS